MALSFPEYALKSDCSVEDLARLVSPEPGSQAIQARPRRWWTRGKESVQDKVKEHLNSEFSGKKGWNGHWFHRPVKQENSTSYHNAAELESDEKGRYIYKNQLGQAYHKHGDVATYLSPTNFTPKRLVVQAPGYILRDQLGTGDWRRTTIKGSVPKVLKMAEWALRPSNPGPDGHIDIFSRAHTLIRVLVVAFPLQIMLVLPTTATWDDAEVAESYTDFPGYHWKWPKHAINPLDQKPGRDSNELTVQNVGSRKRLLRPRQLVVSRDGKWEIDSDPPKDLSYLFISYTNIHFDTDHSATGRRFVEDMAAYATIKAGKTAYWLDYKCRAPEHGPLLDSDVYRMCDVIRGSYQVVVMLKSNTSELRREWGSRMWTLPEALLAPRDDIFFCTPHEDSFQVTSMGKVEMTGSVWDDPDNDGEDGGPTRLLAEHFTGVLTLSRLEILSNAVAALGDRFFNNYKAFAKADVAYALMGLLHYRIEKDEDDTLFQAIARLSLANDNDRLIERMVCLFPDPRDPKTAFEKLSKPDLYRAHLWDIEPLCQVVGVGEEDNTILLDNCKAMHIRWKDFPRMNVVRHYGMKKLIAELFVRSGAWWFSFGIYLTITYAPFFHFSNGLNGKDLLLALELLVGSFFVVGLLLSFLGPYSVRRLYGGQVLQSSANLIGFEGVMPLSQLEPLIFGNNNGRLSYEASATPFCYNYRSPKERVGLEPEWITDSLSNPEGIAAIEAKLPKGHHLFTLVDTGSLSVCIFSAENPPTVALLAGREGGMLRAVLCSWRFGNDCLMKETVVRMPSDVWECAKAKSWIKVSIGR